MELRAFQNRLRQLRYVEAEDFANMGLHQAQWAMFREDPVRWMVSAEDGYVEVVWKFLEDRAPPGQIGGLPETHR